MSGVSSGSPPPRSRWSGMNVETYKELLLEMPQQRSVDSLLQHVTNRIASSNTTALVRIWLLRPADGCENCRDASRCKRPPSCLHLVASAGRSLDGVTKYDRLDGAFRRFTLGVRKVGVIASTGEALMVSPIDPAADWVADPDWIRKEGIASFAGQPLIHKGEVLGVLSLFSRTRFVDTTLPWLRMVADHLAAAIVNARSFEEIEGLKRRLELENVYLRKEVEGELGPQGVIGQSAAMKAILRKISQVAPTDANILVTGESGTGKEVIAREIHGQSKRRARTMIKVNCAAIPRELFESEFFGHAKGSFTGAARERFGLFQAADHGTLFLDEVSEIPLELQGKLLRVLQEREYRRVGEETERTVDVRIIAASNRDLPAAVAAGKFREDLYYRLQVFPFELPPLRERKDDIGALAQHFLTLSSRSLNRPGMRLVREDVELLQGYDWPGNCRELQNVIERAVITAQGERLNIELPGARARPLTTGAPSPALAASPEAAQARILTEDELRALERDNTLAALEKANWRIYGPGSASELLGVKPTTLVSRIKKMGLRRADENEPAE